MRFAFPALNLRAKLIALMVLLLALTLGAEGDTAQLARMRGLRAARLAGGPARARGRARPARGPRRDPSGGRRGQRLWAPARALSPPPHYARLRSEYSMSLPSAPPGAPPP